MTVIGLVHNYNTSGSHAYNRATENEISAATGLGWCGGPESSPKSWLAQERKEKEKAQARVEHRAETKSEESIKLPTMTIVLAFVFVVLVCGIGYSSVSRMSQPILEQVEANDKKPVLLDSGVNLAERRKQPLIEVVKPKVIAAHTMREIGDGKVSQKRKLQIEAISPEVIAKHEERENATRESSGLRNRKSMCAHC